MLTFFDVTQQQLNWGDYTSLKSTSYGVKRFNLLLMEEIPNNHLGCIKPYVMDGINYQPQLVNAGFLPTYNLTLGDLGGGLAEVFDTARGSQLEAFKMSAALPTGSYSFAGII